MAFLEGYFDESGTHETASHIVVSGFIADSNKWRRFVKEWGAALKDQGIPFFKAQWFEKRKEFFRPWGDEEERRKGFMGRLLGTITRLQPTRISFALPMKDYDDIIPPGPARTKIGSAYTLCAIKCIAMAGNWARSAGYTEPISYYFDAGHKNAREFYDAHQGNWKNEQTRDQFLVGMLAFADEKVLLPLQSADLIAYEMAQHLAGNTSRHPLKEIMKLAGEDGQFDRAILLNIKKDYYPN